MLHPLSTRCRTRAGCCDKGFLLGSVPACELVETVQQVKMEGQMKANGKSRLPLTRSVGLAIALDEGHIHYQNRNVKIQKGRSRAQSSRHSGTADLQCQPILGKRPSRQFKDSVIPVSNVIVLFYGDLDLRVLEVLIRPHANT